MPVSPIRVSFPTLRLSRNPMVLSVKIKQERYNHDTGVITFKDWNLSESIIQPGSPILITLNSARYGVSKSIPGYVHHVKKTMNLEQRLTQVFFIGSSYVMKQKTEKVWKRVTLSQVARQIAKKYKFAADITSHPRVFAQLAQHGESDWEFLVKCAKKCGYLFRVDRTTLIFKPIDEYYRKYAQHSHVYTLPNLATDASTIIGATMHSFTPIFGETIPYPDATKSAKSYSGVNPITKKSHKYSNQKTPKSKRQKVKPAIFDSFDTSVVAPGLDVAKSHAEAFSEMNKFPYRAMAEVIGNPDIMPGVPVYLNGIGNDFSGYWVPLAVEHLIHGVMNIDYKYVVSMEVGIDSLGPSNNSFLKNLSVPLPSYSNQVYIEPNIRQVKNLDEPILKTSFIPTKPQYSINFGKIVNKAIDTTTERNESYSYWASSIADVRLRQNKPTARSAYTYQKVRRRCCQ